MAHGEGSVEGAGMSAFNGQGLPQGRCSPPHCSALPALLQCGSLSPEIGPSLSGSAAAGPGELQDRGGLRGGQAQLWGGGGGRRMQRSLDSKQSFHTLLRLWERGSLTTGFFMLFQTSL